MTSDVLPPATTASPASTLRGTSVNEPVVLEVDELIASLRPRLVGTVGDAEVDRLIREAVADLGPVRVTTYLPILIERSVRQRVRTAPDVTTVTEIDLRVGSVTA
jgi:hypothetical protein